MDICILWLFTLFFTTINIRSAMSMTNKTVCNPGFYGNNCSQCGNCIKNNTCSPVDGKCPKGCKEGYIAPLCQKTCNAGFYGDCKQKCGMCRHKNETCSAKNGKCKDGCKNGYIAPFCQKPCNFGFYGFNCSRNCGHCRNNETCSAITGECKSGCQAGYMPVMPPICDTGCLSGYYGYNCTKKCGFCKNGKSCHISTGKCSTGCKDGYISPSCQKPLPNLVSHPYIVDLSEDNKVTSENTATIIIPGVKTITQSLNSYYSSVYIIVSVINSIMKIKVEKSNNFKQIILNHSHYEHAWIAKEILKTNQEHQILLGNEEKSESTQLNETIINYKLEPCTNYEIAIVVINKYSDEIVSNVFYIEFQTASTQQDSHLYIYIVLLAIPYIIFIGICLYITYKRKKKVLDNYTSNNGMASSNTYVDNEYLQIIDINPPIKNSQSQNSQDNEYDSCLGVIQNSDYVNEVPKQEESTYDEVKSQEHEDDALYDIVKNSAGPLS